MLEYKINDIDSKIITKES